MTRFEITADNMPVICRKIRQARTIFVAAQLAGVSHDLWYAWERGRHGMTVFNLARIAKANGYRVVLERIED